MQPKALLFLVLVILVSAAASWFGAEWAVRALQDDTRARVNLSLEAAGQNWAEVETDGLLVNLKGTAPSESGRFRALEVTAQIVDTNRINDLTEISSASEQQTPEFKIEILRNAPELSLIGLVPGKNARLSILGTLDPLRIDGQFTDLMESVEYDAPDNWNEAVELGLDVAARLEKSRVTIKPGRVTVEAFLASQQESDATRTALEALATPDISLKLDLSAPKSVVAPFRFVATKSNGAITVKECWSDDDASQAIILNALSDMDTIADCPQALGAPSSAWGQAVASALTGLGDLAEGTLTITDADIALNSTSRADIDAIGAIETRLKDVLPPLFSLTVSAPDPQSQPEDRDLSAAAFTASLSPSGAVAMRGAVRDTTSKEVAENFAAAQFGQSNVEADIIVSAGVPSGWSPRILAALDALSFMHSGEVSVSPDSIRVTGTSAQADVAEILRETMQARVGGVGLIIDATYDPDLVVATNTSDKNARECERQLATILKEAQIIFDPASSTISDESEILLDQIAFIIASCPNAQFEIGGHTDSQGGDSMNLSLSQARADAVLDTLLTRDVLLSQLSAKGYGETEPIADNETEDGRALNRRIAFKLITSKDDTNE